ncbi:hypothetical protein [Polyangium spumosum]|uniref:Uncharacterized protein n=1 Tax=Polyangium spumosum TaxID=889282 RepID=A0A6N7PX21_9BACT|nr:hypothetical protein [Polyangium spumosum]MRG95396.1 hypothetical protein [Polyangium spumosum]
MSWVLLAALVGAGSGCGNKEGAAGSATPATSGAPSAAAPAGSGAAPSGESGGGAVAQPTTPPSTGTIQVSVKDLQLFHPFSSERAMPNVRDNGTYSTRDQNSAYGVGVIVEATNDTGEVLSDAWLEGNVRFLNGDREVECKFGPDSVGDYYNTTYTLHFNNVPEGAKADPFTGEKPTAWKNESSSTNERVWRPGERIRFVARKNECESVVLADMPPSQIRGRVLVKANKVFVKSYASTFDEADFDLALVGDAVRIRDKASGHVAFVPVREEAEGNRSARYNVLSMTAAKDASKDAPAVPLTHLELRYPIRYTRADILESPPLEFDLPPQSMTLQMVKLPSGEAVHASGNVLVYVKENKVVYQDMAKAKLSLLGITREDVPGAMPEVSFTKNELTGSVKSASITEHADDTALSKGQRKLSVTWNLHLQGDGIDRRLRVPFDIASSEYEKASADLSQVDGGDAAAVAEAKAAEAKAKAAKSAAETKYKNGLKGEREKLAKAFPCADVKIATNRGTKSASNGKAVGEACKALVTGSDDLEVTITYTLDRYEIPVALVYSLAGEFTWSPIASAPLLKLDPR